MSEIAQLITALTALFTSIGGAAAAIIAAVRSGRKTAEQIAQVIAQRKDDKDAEEQARGGPSTLPNEHEPALKSEDIERLQELLAQLNPPKPDAPEGG